MIETAEINKQYKVIQHLSNDSHTKNYIDKTIICKDIIDTRENTFYIFATVINDKAEFIIAFSQFELIEIIDL